MKIFSYKDRPVHLGPYPAEHLKRVPLPGLDTGPRPPRPAPGSTGKTRSELAQIARSYTELFDGFREGEVAPRLAPISHDPVDLTNDLKAACYFLNATQVGICDLPRAAWYRTDATGDNLEPYHQHAVLILMEHARAVEPGSLAQQWIGDAVPDLGDTRCAQLAVVLAAYIRNLGFSARAQIGAASDVEQSPLIVRAGLAQLLEEKLVSPYLDSSFSAAIVTTDMPLAPDRPLAGQPRRDRSLGYVLGRQGTRSGLKRWREGRRASHLGVERMERIKRVPSTTTLILDDEVPRVPKRAAFFERALRGDLGPKAARERLRFAIKHPFAFAMAPAMRAMVPIQDGPVAPAISPNSTNAADNSRAVKSLLHSLGADMVGICEAKPYAWFSHDGDGTPMPVSHKWAIVVVIDQGHETMEGASGDDWISGAQSMRAYLRGAEICGMGAELLRHLGHAARSQTNAKSDVLHIPLVLLAGLGELSRIGELVLNPFLGPRFKTAVITTDLPLVPDQPIDFGLQDMCDKCHKCARECPCDAISYGDKVMFNGYEMWKPDAQRCASYRVTNPKGSACGRCMKMCPYNNEGLLAHRLFLWAAIHLPFTRKWIADLDDYVGNGKRNPIKRWWFDLEWMPGGFSAKPKAVNERDLDIAKGLSLQGKQKMAYYHANMMPPPNVMEPVRADRKAAMAAADLLEIPAQALARHQRGDPAPAHYTPTPPAAVTPPESAPEDMPVRS
ncbi:MAG: Fe-S protein [Alphaproteobacteria bacterium]